MAEPKSAALPLGDAPTHDLAYLNSFGGQRVNPGKGHCWLLVQRPDYCPFEWLTERT
jgi:hypothetical protein